MTIQVYAHLVQNEGELAKKLQNPVANLISVPLQSNWDFGIGPADALRYTLNVQPVIPFSLTSNWIFITRTIMPVIHAESPVKGGQDKSGLGDILQSFFFSPQEPMGGWILGGGPMFLQRDYQSVAEARPTTDTVHPGWARLCRPSTGRP